jgi:RimJ/RimL family protein N-acetyltransferase
VTARPAYPWEAAGSGAPAAFAASLREMIPQLETARTILRAPAIEDFGPYREILMSERAIHMDGPLDRRGAWLDFLQCVANWPLRGHGLWVIEAKDSGETLGFTLICMEYGDREPELGWFLTAAAEGKGYAFEAARAAKSHALEALRLPALVSYIDRVNTRSTQLAEKLGGWADEAASAALGQPGVVVYRHWPPADDEGGMEAYA